MHGNGSQMDTVWAPDSTKAANYKPWASSANETQFPG
jgi:hypothetical protein